MRHDRRRRRNLVSGCRDRSVHRRRSDMESERPRIRAEKIGTSRRNSRPGDGIAVMREHPHIRLVVDNDNGLAAGAHDGGRPAEGAASSGVVAPSAHPAHSADALKALADLKFENPIDKLFV